jgi:hypothetical protein
MSQQRPSAAEMEEARFMALVEMLTTGAMQAMGKFTYPGSTEEPEIHLDQARMMIDLLETLQRKTKGNLSDREARMLEAQLTNLRLTFVDEVNRQKSGGHATASSDEDDDEDEDEDEDEAPQAPEPPAKPAVKPATKSDSRDEESQAKSGFVDKRSSGNT